MTEETNTYTSLLTELETAIDELPDAGSGTVETCTVTLMGEDSTGRPFNYVWTTIDSNGNITSVAVLNNANQSVTITNVVCGSMLLYNPAGSMYNRNYQTSNAEILVGGTTAGFSSMSVFKITAAAGETATITAKYSSGGGSN